MKKPTDKYMAHVLPGGGYLVCKQNWADRLFDRLPPQAFRWKDKKTALRAAKEAQKILYASLTQ